jgi:hypothetical protein
VRLRLLAAQALAEALLAEVQDEDVAGAVLP